MSSRTHVPKYRHYKPKNLAVVRLDGKDHYLGPYDSPESHEKYHTLLANRAAGRSPEAAKQAKEEPRVGATVNQVLLAYMQYAETYYVRDGKPTREIEGIRNSMRALRKLYGNSLAEKFGPLRLKAVRQEMIDQGLCRTEINKRIGRIKRMFTWAVSEELVPPGIGHGLLSVKGLRKNRTTAKESKPVKPIADCHVDAVLPYLPPQLVAMINFQRVTGARPGEVVIARRCDIDMSQDVWVYTVPHHKTEGLGHDRVIAIGPRGQEILKPFLERADRAYLFSPYEAFLWRLENRQICYKKERKTPVYPCELRSRKEAKRARRSRKSQKRYGEHYTTRSYWYALKYAFKRAEAAGVNLTRWHPHQLRHNRATELRKKFGVEATRVALGHACVAATEIYAEQDLTLAVKIARDVG